PRADWTSTSPLSHPFPTREEATPPPAPPIEFESWNQEPSSHLRTTHTFTGASISSYRWMGTSNTPSDLIGSGRRTLFRSTVYPLAARASWISWELTEP